LIKGQREKKWEVLIATGTQKVNREKKSSRPLNSTSIPAAGTGTAKEAKKIENNHEREGTKHDKVTPSL